MSWGRLKHSISQWPLSGVQGSGFHSIHATPYRTTAPEGLEFGLNWLDPLTYTEILTWRVIQPQCKMSGCWRHRTCKQRLTRPMCKSTVLLHRDIAMFTDLHWIEILKFFAIGKQGCSRGVLGLTTRVCFVYLWVWVCSIFPQRFQS